MIAPIYRFLQGLRVLVRRSAVERELDDELRAALDEATAEGLRAGLSQHDARRRAHRTFGGFEAAKTGVREVSWAFWLDGVWRDVGLAVRRLRRTPGFTAVALLTLSLGIGANAALFSLINGLLFRPLPLPASDQLVAVTRDRHAPGVSTFFFSADERRSLETPDGPFDALVVSDPLIGAVAGLGQVSMASGELVSGNFFNALGLRPLLGRLLVPADDRAGTAIVLSENFWRRVFAADPGLVGSTVTMAGETLTVVGIVAAPFDGTWLPTMKPADFFVPVTAAARLSTIQGRRTNEADVHRTFARLRAGVSLEEADAAVRVAGQRRGEDGWAALPVERAILFDEFARPGRYIGLAVLALSTAVFLIACANLMNLFLARSIARRGEFATRLATGAGPRDIRRLVVVEILVITLAAAVLAVGLAGLMSATLARIPLPEMDGMRLHVKAVPDIRAVIAALICAFLAARGIGLLPARQAARTNPVEVLSRAGTGQATASAKDRRTQQRLVVVQVALSVTLVLLAALAVRQARVALPLPLAERTVDAVVARVNLDLHRIPEPEGRRVFDRILTAARAAPGVRVAGLASAAPDGRGRRFAIVTGGVAGTSNLPECSPTNRAGCEALRGFQQRVLVVSPGYLGAAGLSLRAGRDCGTTDVVGTPSVALVDEDLAASLWPGLQPIGQRLFVHEGVRPLGLPAAAGTTYEAIGVVARLSEPRAPGYPAVVYLCMGQQYSPAMTLMASGAVDARRLVEPLRHAVQAAEPQVLLSELGTLADADGFAAWVLMTAGITIGVLGAVGFAIALIGIYGVVAYTVQQRGRELAIRKALGATTASVYRLVLRSGCRMLVVGALVGTSVAAGVISVLGSMVYRLATFDPVTFIVVPAALIAMGLVASWVAARRGVAIDPSQAIKDL